VSPGNHEPTIETCLHVLAQQVLGAITRRHNDFDAAEE
jgi:hypothetical protein